MPFAYIKFDSLPPLSPNKPQSLTVCPDYSSKSPLEDYSYPRVAPPSSPYYRPAMTAAPTANLPAPTS